MPVSKRAASPARAADPVHVDDRVHLRHQVGGGRGAGEQPEITILAGPPPPRARKALILALLCVSLLVVSLDNTILNIALPSIVRDLHASSAQLQWIVDAYAVVYAGLLLVLGSLGDRVGRKRIFTIGLALFAVGSAAAAFSGSPDRLIAARAFMGIGAASIMPSTLSILINVFTGENERSRAIGIWSGTTGLGIAIGPIVGGWLLTHYWWGSVFLVNVPIALTGLVGSLRLIPESRNPASKRPDPVGAVLSVAGMALLLFGIIEAPERTWASPLVLGSIAASLVLLASFVSWERRCDHPMLPLSFFRSRRFSAAIGSLSLVIFSLMGAMFLLTQWLQFSRGYSALHTGVLVSPMAGLLLVLAPLSTVLARVVGTKPVVAFGMASIGIGLWLLSRTTVSGTYWGAFPAFLLLGGGTALVIAPSTDSVMGSLPREEAGVGSATNSTALQVGGALGVGVLGSLLNSRYRGRITPVLAHSAVPVPSVARQFISGSLGGALVVAQHVGGALGSALASFGRLAFVSGMDLAVRLGAIVAAVGTMVVLVALPNRPPPGPTEVSAPPDRRDEHMR